MSSKGEGWLTAFVLDSRNEFSENIVLSCFFLIFGDVVFAFVCLFVFAFICLPGFNINA